MTHKVLVQGLAFHFSSVSPTPLDYLLQYIHAESQGPLSGELQVRVNIVNKLTIPRVDYTSLRSVETYKGYYLLSACSSRGILFVAPDRSYYVLRENDQSIEIQIHKRSRERDSLLLRVVREILYRRLISKGYVSFHAASVDIGGKGLLIVGPSGAGKTTLLLRILREVPSARMIGNDRSLIHPSTSHLCALPLPIRVGLGYCKLWPELVSYLYGGGSLVRHNQLGNMLSISGVANQKLELTPQEVCKLTGANMTPTSTLHSILIPDLDVAADTSRVRVIPAQHLALQNILFNELRSPTDPLWPEPWLVPNSAKTIGHEMFSVKSTGYHVRFGTGISRQPYSDHWLKPLLRSTW